MFGRFLLLLGALALMVGCASAPGAATGDLVMEEFRVPSDAGMQIYVRNKRPAGMTQFSPAKTVIYVHGATYPSETAFDLKLDGLSWMDYMAQRGYDVYLLDVRGYGAAGKGPMVHISYDGYD